MMRPLVRGPARRWKSTTPSNGRFVIKTFNKISAAGLARFDDTKYSIAPADSKPEIAHAILLRSHKLQESDVPLMCRAIARCGAGTNNCNVERMTEFGIPVFNTPGANANAVKELVVCALLLASRGILEGSKHMDHLYEEGVAHERIEKDKAKFGGRELKGKTIGVVGLGAIGAAVTEAASALGMSVVGYDPSLSVEAALRLPRAGSSGFRVVSDLAEVCARADYLTLHAPYLKATHHMIGEHELGVMKPDASILNFARGELVDADALAARYDDGGGGGANDGGKKPVVTGKYVCDFALPENLWKRPQCVTIPHLGASTAEAEENAAAMAADTVQKFLSTGSVEHSVNFPTTNLPTRPDSNTRICVVNENKPGMLAEITAVFGHARINVLQQINASKGDIAYNVIDIAKPGDVDDFTEFNFKSWDALQEALTNIPGVKSTRFVYDNAGAGYAIRYKDQVFGVGVLKPQVPHFGGL